MGPSTTEETLSLIKEEEALCCSDYVLALTEHATSQAASFMFHLRGRRTSEKPTFNLHMTFQSMWQFV